MNLVFDFFLRIDFALVFFFAFNWFDCLLFYGDSVGSEIKSMIDELKSKIEKDR
jgi:hypothetical protein